MITQEELKKLVHYDPETGVITRLGWKGRPRVKHDRYRRIWLGKHLYYEHRLAWLYMTGDWIMVDHENTIKTDNRWRNLRAADKSKNGANRGAPANNTSGFKGVQYDRYKKRWAAFVVHKGKRHRAGRHLTKEAASAAYERRAKELHAEFARAA